MVSRRITISALAASLIGILAGAWAQTERPTAGTVSSAAPLPSSTPYSSQDGLIILKARVGTGVAQDAVLATGLPLSLISPELATKQSIQGQGIFDLATLGGPARVQNSAPQQMTIGRVPVDNVPVGIFDLYTHLSSRPLPGSPSVWLGWSALGSLCITIDPEKRELTFNPPAAPPPRKSMVVPFELQDGKMYVQAKLNGHRGLRMLVDTASVGTLIPADAARALRLPELATLPIKSAGGKESRVTAVSLNELALAGMVKIKDVRALYISAGDTPDLGPDTGLLGTDALLRHRVTIHYGRSTIAFEKIEPKKDMVQTAPPITPAAQPSTPGAQPPVTPAKVP